MLRFDGRIVVTKVKGELSTLCMVFAGYVSWLSTGDKLKVELEAVRMREELA